MAFCLEKLKKDYVQHMFFTSCRECIEYLLAVNLEPLEEYALLALNGKIWVLTPHELLNNHVEEIIYQGYSNKKYQNKTKNILDKLDEMTFPAKVHTAFEKQVYADYLKYRGAEVLDVTERVEREALDKTDEQIKAIESCILINERVYRSLSKTNVRGETELSLFRCVEESIMKSTSYNNRKIYDFIAGKRTAEVSGYPTNYSLKEEDTLIVDLLPRHKGVFADMTRTFFVGSPTEKQKWTYEILLEAMQAAEDKLRPGSLAGDIYESMMKVFKKYKVENNFPHHAGHGIGMGYYDAPYFLKEEKQTLREKMVVALEPGLYFPGEYGVRIENNYLITREGAKRLGGLSLNLEDYILSFEENRKA